MPGAVYVPSQIPDIDKLPVRLYGLTRLPPISTRPNPLTGGSTTTTTGVTSHTKHYAPFGAHQLQVCAAALYASTNGENALPNRTSWKFAIEYPWNSGTRYPVYFRGVRTVTLEGGAITLSDPVGVDIAAGGYFGVYCYCSTPDVPGTDIYPRGYETSFSDGEGVYTGGDRCDSGTVTASQSTGSPWSYCVYGVADYGRTPKTVIISGDSISAGAHNAYSGEGYVPTALGGYLAGTWTMINISKSSETTTNFTGTQRQRRITFAAGADIFITNYGTNDFGTNTVATIKTNLIDIWTAAKARGCKVYQVTIIPKSSSSDGWITVANQSIGNASNESGRIALNAWLRAPASAGSGNSALYDAGGVLDGVIDPTTLLEVNSDGSAITINGSTGAISNGSGGRWAVYSGGNVTAYTANAGVTSSGAVLTDTRQSWTTNQWAGATIICNSQYRRVLSNTATTLTLNNPFTFTVSNQAYTLYYKVATFDGTHPLWYAYDAVKSLFQTLFV